jgi:hypothetical protein
MAAASGLTCSLVLAHEGHQLSLEQLFVAKYLFVNLSLFLAVLCDAVVFDLLDDAVDRLD